MKRAAGIVAASGMGLEYGSGTMQIATIMSRKYQAVTCLNEYKRHVWLFPPLGILSPGDTLLLQSGQQSCPKFAPTGARLAEVLELVTVLALSRPFLGLTNQDAIGDDTFSLKVVYVPAGDGVLSQRRSGRGRVEDVV